MDSDLLSVLGIVLQTYASILGLIGMFILFYIQNKKDKIHSLKTRLKIKSDSLIDFINRELASAYDDSLVIRVDRHNYDEVIEAIEQYELDRKKDIPDLDMEDLKIFINLWKIVEREREELIQFKNELSILLGKPVMSNKTFFFFVGYFIFELIFGFTGIGIVFIEHKLQNLITYIILVSAVVGVIPLGNLLYDIKKG